MLQNCDANASKISNNNHNNNNDQINLTLWRSSVPISLLTILQKIHFLSYPSAWPLLLLEISPWVGCAAWTPAMTMNNSDPLRGSLKSWSHRAKTDEVLLRLFNNSYNFMYNEHYCYLLRRSLNLKKFIV